MISYRKPPAIGDTFYETAPIQIDDGCDTDCDTLWYYDEPPNVT